LWLQVTICQKPNIGEGKKSFRIGEQKFKRASSTSVMEPKSPFRQPVLEAKEVFIAPKGYGKISERERVILRGE